MDQEKVEKRKPILTIIAAVLCLLSLLAVTVLLYFLLGPYNEALAISAFLLPFFAIPSFVLTLISKREGRKKIWIALLFFSIALGVMSFVLPSFAGVKLIFGGIQDSSVKRAREHVNIDYVKSLVPSKNLELHTKETEESPFPYFDDDGAIAKQFLTMEYTLECDSSCHGLSQTYFSLSNDVKVTFYDDFTGIVVQAIDGTFWGYGEAYASYSVDANEGKKIGALINGKVEEQKRAYESKEAEARAGLSLPSALDAMETDDPDFVVTLFDEQHSNGSERLTDENKELLQAFRELDDSKIRDVDSEELYYYARGFNYFSTNTIPCSIRYFADAGRMRITRQYEDPHGTKRSVYADYQIPTEEGDRLMAIAQKIVAEKEGVSLSSQLDSAE